MKLMSILRFSVLLIAACFIGCSGSTGAPGDANDPAASGGSDEEQMADETGNVELPGGEE